MIYDINEKGLPSLETLTTASIKNIVFDSSEAGEHSLFCALLGTHTDGHNFIEKAFAGGCRNFLISNKSFATNSQSLYILCCDTRKTMASLASILYNKPSKDIFTIGITGTDGKSTSVYLVSQLLELCGYKTGLISTVNFKTGSSLEENTMRQSTPEAPQIEEALSTMLNNQLDYAIIESTSHGLSDKTSRLKEIEFKAGLFTNVTIEHLEFHGTLEQYRSDKANLFKMLAKSHGISVINAKDEHASLFLEAAKGSNIYTYNLPNSDLWATNINAVSTGNYFSLTTKDASMDTFIKLPGLFNVENVLGALLLVAKVLNKNIFDVAKHLGSLKAPKGRMLVVLEKPFTVIIDYAHTPGSFEKLLPSVKQTCKGKLIVLFGSGGERNVEKRPIQGEIADKYADIVILTEEDPRLEDNLNIMRDIALGIHNKVENENLFLISNRLEAIEKALSIANKDDVVLLLGKGHEGSILRKEGKTLYDEEQTTLAILKKLNISIN